MSRGGAAEVDGDSVADDEEAAAAGDLNSTCFLSLPFASDTEPLVLF